MGIGNVKLSLLIVILLLAGCNKKSGDEVIDGMTGVGMKNVYEQMDRQLTVGMQLDVDSVLALVDSLQTNGYLPLPIADYERGTCYALQEKRRMGEYYYQKAIGGGRLFELWPEAYYRAATNLAILLQGKNDDQGAIQVATEAMDKLKSRTEDASSRWLPSLLFTIGSSQLRLGYNEEGLASLRESMTSIKKLAHRDSRSDVLRTWATLAVNTVSAISNSQPESLKPWLKEADEAMAALSRSHEVPPALIDMLRSRQASLKSLYYISKGRTQEAWRAHQTFMATDYAKQPRSFIDQLTFLEAAGRWEEAAKLLPDIWKMHDDNGTEANLDFMSDLIEGFHVYRQAGYDNEALLLGDRMVAIIDSVKAHVQQNAAAELAVIYDSEQQKEQLFRQQWRLRRQQGAAVAVILTLIIAFVMTYMLIRRREAHRLKVAYGLLKERNEELVIANQKAEESSRMKTKFIQQISHEIRTPLNILSGFTQVVTTPGIELADQEKLDISQRITDNTNRITQLVNKMLELSEASAHMVIERNDSVTVEELTAAAIDMSGITSAQHLSFDIISGIPHDMRITTNRRYAVKALAMLLDNAKKFTHEPCDSDNLIGEIPEKLQQVRLIVDAPDAMVRFTIEDTGCGVPPEEAEHIFEEFVQLNEFYEGTGIGLSVARSIARRLGGDVTLDTSYTGGARFIMTLIIN